MIDVVFSMHCFTRGNRGEKTDPAMTYSDNRETRIFDFGRYALSHPLPAIIDSLMTCKCFHTDHGNFFTIEVVDAQGRKVEYEIYFTVLLRPVFSTWWCRALIRAMRNTGAAVAEESEADRLFDHPL